MRLLCSLFAELRWGFGGAEEGMREGGRGIEGFLVRFLYIN